MPGRTASQAIGITGCLTSLIVPSVLGVLEESLSGWPDGVTSLGFPHSDAYGMLLFAKNSEELATITAR